MRKPHACKTTYAVFALLLVFAMLSGSGLHFVVAQEPDAWTDYQLNMRSGPDGANQVIATLPGNTGLVLQARTEDASWVLGVTTSGAFRGWVASLYLRFRPGFYTFDLPISSEIVAAGAISAEAPAPSSVEQSSTQTEQAAPGGVSAFTAYDLNIRSGPGTTYSALGNAPGGTGLILEARNADASWVLAHTENGVYRGWFASLYLNFSGVNAANLPYSDEIVAAGTANSGSDLPLSGSDPRVSYNDIRMGGYDPALIEGIDLMSIPVVGNATGNARQIFLNGRAMGRDSGGIAKIGDCSSAHWYFLRPFGWGQYNLGAYADLQGVVDQFATSMAHESFGAHNGFNVNAVQDPSWAHPGYCQAGEAPFECEIRLVNASVAIIMFGTSDLLVMTPYEFDFYMRSLVHDTIDLGVIPILSTFPGNQGFWNETILYNQIVVRIARDFDIPLINLFRALNELPNNGLEPDGFHLGEPLGAPADLSGTNLSTGYPTRNLVTLQTLDNVWRNAMR